MGRRGRCLVDVCCLMAVTDMSAAGQKTSFAFKKDVISKADLNDIMQYMKSMKRREKLPS